MPRQPGLVSAARGYLELLPDFAHPEAFEGVEGFSHLWVIFGFSACEGRYGLRVRPPRLGGNEEMGVFATRSPFRPNNLGLSVLTFEGLESSGTSLRLGVSGLDMIDGTPVYDIKPYVPYTDSVPEARGGFAASAPAADLEVFFSDRAEDDLNAAGDGSALRELIIQTLALDPRPAYQRADDARLYGMQLSGHDVRWRLRAGQVQVEQVMKLKNQ